MIFSYFAVAIFFTSVFASPALNNANDDSDPTVTTPCGTLRGKIIATEKGKCDTYLGVQFGRPPIGSYRWKKPEPGVCWKGTKDFKEFGPRCMQGKIAAILAGNMSPKPQMTSEESEDCLYLNIFIPKSLNTTNSPLPVMVFIHGGAFTFGSSRDYGQEGICENLALRGVIVITIQYRLDIFGFLSTGDDAALGNYGIWDQIQALRWVKKYIADFGGDPEKVTIFGESAGGASVSYLTYIPLAKDLFQRSIAESGSVKTSWAAISDKSVPTTKKLAELANCSNPDTKVVINCLQQLSTLDLLKLYYSMNVSTDFFSALAARVDNELFHQSDPAELKLKKPAIIGTNSFELTPDKNTQTFDQLLDGYFGGNNSLRNEVLKEIVKYVYIDLAGGDRRNPTFLAQQVAMGLSDVQFHTPAATEALSKTAGGDPVWVYNFDYYSENVFKPGYPYKKGAPHAHELCYLFLLAVPKEARSFLTCPDVYDGEYRRVADYLGEMWTNFAITGNPSPKNIEWPKFQSLSNANAMTIRSNLSIESNYYLDTSMFWLSLKPNIESIFAPGF